MAITLFGVKVTPADSTIAAQAGPGPITITPPSAMAVGDLVVVTQQYRGGETFSIANAGGQSWNTLAERNASSVCDAIVHWARYNGTWAANPQFQVASGTLALTTVMGVFRPTISAANWVIDVAQNETQFSAPLTPFTVTLTGRNVSANTVTVAIWYSVDDNTWGTLAGTGWSKTGLGAQYRNTTGSDQSLSIAYYSTVSAAAVPNVSQNQATLGGDFGTGGLITWQQQNPVYTITGAITGIGAVAATLVYNLNASISGAITGSAAIAATLAYNRNASLIGVITGAAVIAAAMEYAVAGAAYEIVGAITGVATISAALAYNLNAAIAGAITGAGSIAATLAYNQNPVIVGMITGLAVVASTMQYAVGVTSHEIVGSVIATARVGAFRQMTWHYDRELYILKQKERKYRINSTGKRVRNRNYW